jgi:hypothetical protein
MPGVCSPSFRQPSEDGWAHRIRGPISKFHLRRTQFHIHDSVDSMIYEQSDPAALIERIDFLDPTADCGPDSNARVDEMQLLGRVPWVSLSELGQLRSWIYSDETDPHTKRLAVNNLKGSKTKEENRSTLLNPALGVVYLLI